MKPWIEISLKKVKTKGSERKADKSPSFLQSKTDKTEWIPPPPRPHPPFPPAHTPHPHASLTMESEVSSIASRWTSSTLHQKGTEIFNSMSLCNKEMTWLLTQYPSMCTSTHTHISTHISSHNEGVSQAWYIVEIHPSGQKPSIYAHRHRQTDRQTHTHTHTHTLTHTHTHTLTHTHAHTHTTHTHTHTHTLTGVQLLPPRMAWGLQHQEWIPEWCVADVEDLP